MEVGYLSLPCKLKLDIVKFEGLTKGLVFVFDFPDRFLVYFWL